MTTILRAVAVVVGLTVVVTAGQVFRFAFPGTQGARIPWGALALSTLIAWLMILAVGPVAAIQLWRLRRIGLAATALLCGVAFMYYLSALLFFRNAEAPVQPPVAAAAINGAFLALLLSPAARRRVS